MTTLAKILDIEQLQRDHGEKCKNNKCVYWDDACLIRKKLYKQWISLFNRHLDEERRKEGYEVFNYGIFD